MSKLPSTNSGTNDDEDEVKLIERGLCKVEHQPGAEWPLYYYNI